MKDYQAIRGSLLNMLEELDDNLGTISSSTDSLNLPTASLDATTVQPLATINTAAHNEVEKIKLALAKMDQANLPICSICGQTIPQPALLGAANANLCVDCVKSKL